MRNKQDGMGWQQERDDGSAAGRQVGRPAIAPRGTAHAVCYDPSYPPYAAYPCAPHPRPVLPLPARPQSHPLCPPPPLLPVFQAVKTLDIQGQQLTDT